MTSTHVDALACTPSALSDREFEQFQRLIHQIAGIHLSDAKKPLVAGRLSKRLRSLGMASYGEYFKRLSKDTAELQTCVDLLTTNETYFFREPKHFDFLREQLSKPGAIPNGRPLRIWSGACSSGEEPYTLALLLADILGERPWEILASDISQRILDRARTGVYDLEDGQNIPRHLLIKHCLRGIDDNVGRMMVAPALRKRIRFEQINLNTALPDHGLFDTIFLRNVMIYFNAETKRQVVSRLIKHLRPGGYFFVSHSESLNGVDDTLKLVKPSIYRKPND
ncbi:MAG: protein-glutamate O-methyltransferase CheR [Gammaproteobacteria bacterium]|nr:protein-glutamate O-methyltransferase CheR [Gammaproteobacteria bacterium]MBU1488894.1 protein-glutamate O-methyltransferase CheR [Gammaproteobacteria bacterium]MBU2067449.1 protein-glutamate O-methyltransferase CheR [Gammaproteobacteria bacterium]MBU2138884.1 protein-glutamate O-methyltransferase CheR [Gammaproteobacteria bacterium]MBU2216707.1 protein-glutamate O-methyltransferase CheR [Gammaproteobacteria bacterium]